MKKLLIAESSEIRAGAIERALRTHCEVHFCCNGRDALSLLDVVRPDALLLNLSLPDTDGFTLLESAQYVPPKILALTCYIDQYVCAIAALHGIGGILMLPCSIHAIIKNLDELLQI